MDKLNIGFWLYPDCLPSGLLAFADLMAAANMRVGKPVFTWCWISESGDDYTGLPGMTIATTRPSAAKLDAVLIPGAWRDEASVLKQADQPLIASLRAMNPSIAVWSYCTGVCLVAEAGRLEGLAATT